jgi:hypothetical protein
MLKRQKMGAFQKTKRDGVQIYIYLFNFNIYTYLTFK